MRTGHDLELKLAPTLEAVAPARHQLAVWLSELGVAEPAAADLVTAASELCTNGVRVAKDGVVLRAFLDRDAVVIEVSDDGPGLQGGGEIPPADPDPLADRGWGLHVARQMVDVLWLGTDEVTGGIKARCAKRLST